MFPRGGSDNKMVYVQKCAAEFKMLYNSLKVSVKGLYSTFKVSEKMNVVQYCLISSNRVDSQVEKHEL